jgi:hypothetical protein
MKTLTVTLRIDPAATPPANAAGFVGFKLTLRKLSNNQTSAPPVSTDLVWQFGPLLEGEQVELTVQSVNAAGGVIVSLPVRTEIVPSGIAYQHLAGFDLAWADAA